MNPNELDDFLRKKEAEFDVPFREEYWEKAQDLLQRERRHRPAAFWNARMLGLTGAVTLLSGIAVWYLLSTKPINNVENNAVATSSLNATPYFESNDNSNNATATQVSNTTVNASTADAAIDNNSSVNYETTSATNTSTETRNNNPENNFTSVSNNTATSVATSASTLTTRNATSGSTRSNVAASSRTNRSTNPVVETPVVETSSELAAIPTLSQNRISYRNLNVIPVFEDMTPNDPALLRFYGLYYKSSGTPSRKIREFKHGAQYPQISWSAVGGLNVFNHFKENVDSLSYIATNPYVGLKFGYQWNPKWSLCLQPMLAQRGGIRLTDSYDPFVPVENITAYRHLYYLQMPVMLGVQLSKRNNVSFGGGASVLLVTGSKQQNVEKEDLGGSYDLKQSDGFKRVDYFAAVGYQFRMSKKIGFQAGFKYGLADVTKNEYFGSTQQHHNIQTSLGITYQFYQEKLQLR